MEKTTIARSREDPNNNESVITRELVGSESALGAEEKKVVRQLKKTLPEKAFDLYLRLQESLEKNDIMRATEIELEIQKYLPQDLQDKGRIQQLEEYLAMVKNLIKELNEDSSEEFGIDIGLNKQKLAWATLANGLPLTRKLANFLKKIFGRPARFLYHYLGVTSLVSGLGLAFLSILFSSSVPVILTVFGLILAYNVFLTLKNKRYGTNYVGIIIIVSIASLVLVNLFGIMSTSTNTVHFVYPVLWIFRILALLQSVLTLLFFSGGLSGIEDGPGYIGVLFRSGQVLKVFLTNVREHKIKFWRNDKLDLYDLVPKACLKEGQTRDDLTGSSLFNESWTREVSVNKEIGKITIVVAAFKQANLEGFEELAQNNTLSSEYIETARMALRKQVETIIEEKMALVNLTLKDKCEQVELAVSGTSNKIFLLKNVSCTRQLEK